LKIRSLVLVAFVIAVLVAFVSSSKSVSTRKKPSNSPAEPGSLALKLRPIPVRIYEHPDSDDWILLSPSGYFEYVERDYKSPKNNNGHYPLRVRVSGSYRELPVKKKSLKGEVTIETYHLVFNIDQKSLIRLTDRAGQPKFVTKLAEKFQRSLTERVEDGIEAEVKHGEVDTLVTGMRIITSPLLAASSLVKKSWSHETFVRIGPVRFLKLLDEGRPESGGGIYDGEPTNVID
jgi:hypothetical protein